LTGPASQLLRPDVGGNVKSEVLTMSTLAPRFIRVGLLFAVLGLAGLAVPVRAARADGDLATVRLPRATMANGETLPAGTYAVRLSDTAVTPVVGQSPDGARWVEFVQAGSVKGRELATVLSGPAVKQVAKEAPPTAGHARVELLAGAQYLRIWINQDGTSYLVHLAISPAR
jgi:hypothetical protein